MASSVSGMLGALTSAAPSAFASALPSVPVIASIRPAWAISVSAETFRAPEIALSTRTDGWCRPRSTWLR